MGLGNLWVGMNGMPKYCFCQRMITAILHWCRLKWATIQSKVDSGITGLDFRFGWSQSYERLNDCVVFFNLWSWKNWGLKLRCYSRKVEFCCVLLCHKIKSSSITYLLWEKKKNGTSIIVDKIGLSSYFYPYWIKNQVVWPKTEGNRKSQEKKHFYHY